MKAFLQGVKRWYLRRFRGYVGPPRDPLSGVPRGTAWQQHKPDEVGVTCRCGYAMAFTESDYFIREQDHREGCEGVVNKEIDGKLVQDICSCPITDARYVKFCSKCGLGHWKQSEGK